MHICMVFGYDLLYDLLEMLNLINIGSAVATRRNLFNPISIYFLFLCVFFSIIPFLFFILFFLNSKID
jgi:hypothetical protein